MKIFAQACSSGINFIRNSHMRKYSVRIVIVLMLLTSASYISSAQSLIWTDDFTQGLAPTTAQCNNWTDFLTVLGENDFVSVTISGTFLTAGIKITDPAAAKELARLLSLGLPGSVTSDGHTWQVGTGCGGSCVASGVELVVDGGGCSCDDQYVIRAHSGNFNWGGLNGSCDSESQTMKLEFESGANITASGPTSICKGESVTLTASSTKCSGPYTYLWSNGETSESITVSQSGTFSVKVSDASGCIGTSTKTQVAVNALTVDAGEDVTICGIPFQLNAVSSSNPPAVTKYCMYDAVGGVDNCTFISDLCSDGAEYFFSTNFNQTVSIANPLELRFLLYYSACSDIVAFTFKLNGNIIGSFEETNRSCACNSSPAGQYPRKITFGKTEFQQFWNEDAENLLTVEITTDPLAPDILDIGVYLGGIVTEVVSQTEFFSWSPATGLSDASIRNPVANPDVSTTYTVTYRVGDGCSATDQITVKSCGTVAPVAVCKPVVISADVNCTGNASAIDFNNGSTSEDGGALKYSVLPIGPYPVGMTTVELTVTNEQGQTSSCSTTVTVTDDVLPTIETPENISATNDAGLCSATVVLTTPQASDNCGVKSITSDQPDNVFPIGETIVKWTVTDIHGNTNSSLQTVTVTNHHPVIHFVEASGSVVPTNSTISLSTSYTDNNVIRATIDWNDHSGLQEVINPGILFKASHIYNNAGLYSATITLTDACGATAAYVYNDIVVYDLNGGGYVTGNGWYQSPQGAYISRPSAMGKASFNFVVKYKKQGNVPKGNTEFEFNTGKLKFRSSDYKWLVVEDNTAVFKGSGKLNGTSGYEILISVVDDDKNDDDDDDDDDDDNDKFSKNGKKTKKADHIRVKISDPSGSVVYDTQIGAPDEAEALTKIGGGYIRINNGKPQQLNQVLDKTFAEYSREAETDVYPNPFKESLTVQFYSSSKQGLHLQLLDVSGKAVYDQNHAYSEDGEYSIQLPEAEGKSGLYILKINQGRIIEYIKVMRK